MIQEFNFIGKVNGELTLPGDKSISHRSVMFASLAEGESVIHNCLNADDINSTIRCFKQLGCDIKKQGSTVKVIGRGFKGFKKPAKELYAGNSGTTARIISGILCAQDFETVITGDESLSKRPMKRIIGPLTQMGGKLKASEGDVLPMRISPSAEFHAFDYKMDVASAQVKSAVLLAGLHLNETTFVTEFEKTRNHTENLLGLKVTEFSDRRIIEVSKRNYPSSFEIFVPSDISSASFLIVLTLLSENSELILNNVLLNETRTGILKVLLDMGADIEITGQRIYKGEKTGTLIIRSSKLANCPIDKDLIPNIIDEIPVLSIAGAFAEGKFEVRNAKELRMKESDRINSMCSNFKYIGFEVEEFEDGFSVGGTCTDRNMIFESYQDHRIAMSFAVFSMLQKNGGKVNNFECVEISNPDFLKQIKKITS